MHPQIYSPHPKDAGFLDALQKYEPEAAQRDGGRGEIEMLVALGVRGTAEPPWVAEDWMLGDSRAPLGCRGLDVRGTAEPPWVAEE